MPKHDEQPVRESAVFTSTASSAASPAFSSAASPAQSIAHLQQISAESKEYDNALLAALTESNILLKSANDNLANILTHIQEQNGGSNHYNLF